MNFEEYERKWQSEYEALAATAEAILTAAISAEGSRYQLQQVKARSKQPDSLRRKMDQRGIKDTASIEKKIKDLAGCRIIFYTNNDVTRFINSGIVHQNFEVLEVKVHQPRWDAEDETDPYTAIHYWVVLSPTRLTLPEYARFTNMQCEIQVRTALHHTWAEMAHSTIYKPPELANFGSKAFNDIKVRMKKVAKKYLVPADYEYQKIAVDFQRLLDGKTLFDDDALEVFVEASDNNARCEAIKKFAEYVLPFYDDLPTIYPKVVERLLIAAYRSRATHPLAIETPHGVLPAKTSSDVVISIVEILRHYRDLDVSSTFNAMCKLYEHVVDEDEANKLIELGKELAKHNLNVWRHYGPVVQSILLDCAEVLSEDQQRAMQPLLTPMMVEILGTEIKARTQSSSKVTFHQAPVVATDELRAIRTKAIDLLKRQFVLAQTDEERRTVLQAFETGMRPPYRGVYSDELQRMVMEDIRTFIDFQHEIAHSVSLELLRTSEVCVHRYYWIYVDLPEEMCNDQALVNARGYK